MDDLLEYSDDENFLSGPILKRHRFNDQKRNQSRFFERKENLEPNEKNAFDIVSSGLAPRIPNNENWLPLPSRSKSSLVKPLTSLFCA